MSEKNNHEDRDIRVYNAFQGAGSMIVSIFNACNHAHGKLTGAVRLSEELKKSDKDDDYFDDVGRMTLGSMGGTMGFIFGVMLVAPASPAILFASAFSSALIGNLAILQLDAHWSIGKLKSERAASEHTPKPS